MADLLESLPTDQNPLNHYETQFINSLFKKENHYDIKNIAFELKESIAGGVLFIILSIPYIDDLVKRFIPSTTNSLLILLFIKGIIFIALFWIITNYALARII